MKFSCDFARQLVVSSLNIQTSIVLLFVLGLLSQAGCRGYTSENPPFHVNPNMDTQEKGKAYRESDFFENKQYMRPAILGTVARGELQANEVFYTGMKDGERIKYFPKELEINEAFMKRGQQIYNRSCAACHAHIGDGNGLVGKRLLVKPTSLHSDYMYSLPPGHYFHVITNGIRTMQPYKHLINDNDRWAVVAYIRSLQISQDMNGEWIKRSASWWKQE